MRPADDVPRLLECGNAMLLVEKASHLAMRVYLTLFWGDGSEKPGIGRCGPGELADVLGSSRRAIVAALDELKSLGLIAWSESERLAYRPGFALRFNPDNYITHTNWLNTANRLRDGVIRAQVLADIGPQRPPPKPRGAALPSPPPAPLLSAPSISSAPSLSSPTETPGAVAPAGKPAVLPGMAGEDSKRKPPGPKPDKAVYTEDAVREYLQTLGAPDRAARFEATKFVGYYANAKPLKDWRQAARGWLTRARERDPALDRACSAAEGGSASASEPDDPNAKAWDEINRLQRLYGQPITRPV